MTLNQSITNHSLNQHGNAILLTNLKLQRKNMKNCTWQEACVGNRSLSKMAIRSRYKSFVLLLSILPTRKFKLYFHKYIFLKEHNAIKNQHLGRAEHS